MILNCHGIVLSRRKAGEYDRLAVLLTETRGKLTARFGGVDRPAGKLKALCEPMTSAEYRLHISPRSGLIRVIGGQLRSTWPSLRSDFGRTLQALACCEMADRLLADGQKASRAYGLLGRALQAIESSPLPSIEAAFGLQLLELAGLSLRELPVPSGEQKAWAALHEPEFGRRPMSLSLAAIERFRQIVFDHVEAHAEKRLRTRLFSERVPHVRLPAGGLARC